MGKEKILIIAEAGVNHNGSPETAKRLVETAKDCGADIVKFQTAKLDLLVSKAAPMAVYQKNNIGTEKSQKEMLSDLLLSYEDFSMLHDYCKAVNIQFLSTPFDIESIHFLNPLQNIWKIPSGEITNYPYLIEIARTGKAVILSTGMSEMCEIRDAIGLLEQNGTGSITLLHCTTEYPAPFTEVNLRVLDTLRKEFHCPVGYSDHTRGISVSIAAAALGAGVIEKHLTLDRNMHGPDHKASLEPDEFKAMVKSIREVEDAMGVDIKASTQSEQKNRAVARKSIVAAKAIRAGEVFTDSNLTIKRPGTGISPMKWNEVMGKSAVRNFEEDELIEL